MLEDKYPNIRTRALRRTNDKNKAIRKKKLSDSWTPLYLDENGNIYHYYNNLHQYSKNKIHCSCPMCRKKTKSTHRGMSWEGSGRYDYKMSERKQQARLDNSLYEYFLEDGREATADEIEAVHNYIESISEDTGINIFDYLNNK